MIPLLFQGVRIEIKQGGRGLSEKVVSLLVVAVVVVNMQRCRRCRAYASKAIGALLWRGIGTMVADRGRQGGVGRTTIEIRLFFDASKLPMTRWV